MLLCQAHANTTDRDSNPLGQRLLEKGAGDDTNTRQYSDLIKHLEDSESKPGTLSRLTIVQHIGAPGV